MNKYTFLASLSGYASKRFWALPINWWYVGAGITGSIMVISLSYSGQTMVGVTSTREAIVKATRFGDYQLAQDLYEQCQVTRCQSVADNILGVDSEIEDLVYPERKIEREIVRYEDLNTKYPESRDILRHLSKLYGTLGDKEKEQVYREQARILDPNNEIFNEK